MNTKKISMQTIADKLGITKMSVSKALNNQPGIGDDLKKQIVQCAIELGYTKAKNNYQPGKKSNFGFLVPKRFFLENESFYTTIYYYLNKKCIANQNNLSLFIVGSSDENKLIIPTALNKEHVEGLFIAGEFDETYLFGLSNLGIPMIFIDFYKAHIQSDCILTDNFFMGYSTTTYLLERGHRKVGFVGNTSQTSSIMDRFLGYRKALDYYRIEYNNDWNIVNNDVSTGYYYMDFVLPDSIPTAFVCHCDMAAYFLIQKLQSMNLKVPNHVSTISFDNTELSKFCAPTLTTVDISKRDFAEKAYNQMITRLSNPELPPSRVYLNTQIIERESVGRIEG